MPSSPAAEKQPPSAPALAAPSLAEPGPKGGGQPEVAAPANEHKQRRLESFENSRQSQAPRPAPSRPKSRRADAETRAQRRARRHLSSAPRSETQARRQLSKRLRSLTRSVGASDGAPHGSQSDCRHACLRRVSRCHFLRAQSRTRKAPLDPVAAEALFEEGRRALEKNDLETACAKFEESQKLDPSVGTLMNWATCEQRRGHVATAWQRWRQALESVAAKRRSRSVCKEAGGSARTETAAAEHHAQVGCAAGVRVVRDGVELGQASLGTPIPVDPGVRSITARAPGFEPRTFTSDDRRGRTEEHRSRARQSVAPRSAELGSSASTTPRASAARLGIDRRGRCGRRDRHRDRPDAEFETGRGRRELHGQWL